MTSGVSISTLIRREAIRRMIMIVGTHKNISIDDELDCDGELTITPAMYMDDWLTKSMAISVIKHLSLVFGLDVIVEAVEKLEESNK